MKKPVGISQRPNQTPWRKRLVARAMIESGIPRREVAKTVGISTSTLQLISKDPELTPDNLLRAKDLIPGRFYQKVHKCLDHMTDDKFQRLNALQLSIAAKVNLQAAREAEGLPSHTIVVKRVAVNLAGELKDLQARKERLLSSLGGTSVDAQIVSPKGNGKVKRIA